MPTSSAMNGHEAGGHQTFHFVGALDTGADSRRRARSHAVKRALQQKRKLQLDAQDNFRVVSSDTMAMLHKGPRNHDPGCQGLTRSPSPGMLDPFEVLAVDARMFQRLLYHRRATQASEPVFSVVSDSSFHSFTTVFRGGLDDPALGNAAMLMLSFSIAEGAINTESLRYQTLALGHLRERMASVERATSLGTLGTILFLAGVEARLGKRDQVQTHLNAIQKLLDIGRSKGLSLTAGIKRAIFWQDLNSAIMTGSSRIVDHNTFVELHWGRDPFAQNCYELPLGLRPLADLLSADFVTILEDVHALELIRNQARVNRTPDPLEIAYINNHLGSVQSRLFELTDLCAVLDCVRLAASLCACLLCCRVWCGRIIPDHISAKLHVRLQVALDEEPWDDRIDLLRWLVCMGASFATVKEVRAGYVELAKKTLPKRLGQEGYARFLRPQCALDEAMGKFIWSATAFAPQIHDFWAEVTS